jgi:hypothetical protein
MMRTLIEARKHGIDFAASMKEINALVKETSGDMVQIDTAEG